MIDFTIHHKKEPLNKILAVELPMNADNLSDLLQELGYEPPEKLKVNSKGKPYVIELNSDINMGFAILERLCDNDTIADNEHFKSIKNMIIRSAAEMQFDIPAAEDDAIIDDIEEDTEIVIPDEYDYEPADTEESSGNYYFKWSDEYKSASKILRSKDSTEADKAKALDAMKSEADKGNVLAIHDMGKYTSDEDTAKSYYTKALVGFIQVEPKAQKMRSYFQYRIGKMYLYGCGTEKTPDTAFKWLEKSAMSDNKYAQHTLGNMYCYGIGTEKDLSQSFDFYSKAARKGMPYSDYALAQMYYYGSGVWWKTFALLMQDLKDYSKALRIRF